IHGQHDDRALVDVATHRAALDAFAELEGKAAGVRAAWQKLTDAQEAVATQKAQVAEALAQEDYARHTVEELTKLAASVGEEGELAERRQHLQQLERSASEVNETDEILNGSNAPGPALSSLLRRLTRKIDGGASLFQPIVDALDVTLVALD